MKLSRFLAGASALGLCLLPGLRAAPAGDGGDAVIARIGDTQVTAGEIRAAIQNLDAKTQQAAASDPSALSQVVRALLTQRLILRQALDKKWDQDPAVTAALARLRDSAIAQTYLNTVSAPPASYPSDAELQAAYDANKAQLLVPRQYDLAQIFVKDVKGDVKDARDDDSAAKAQVKLDALRKTLGKKDADFGAIARAESDEPDSASRGGEIGWLTENRIQPEIRQQLGSLGKGSVSQPVRLADGWHVIKVLDVKDPYTPALPEIKPQLVQQMRAERARALSQQYIARLVQDNPIQVNELNLSKILQK